MKRESVSPETTKPVVRLKNGDFALALVGFEASYGEAPVTFVVVAFASEVAIVDISEGL